ncbi:PucR family transcriptional regulator [Konateibacter massiliensis]|uniref:PucR family transcriptional regulator n=1 Tax=Konateibacter massiliensis TaxID=2002841 RepID=UPI000C15F955|nr:PucR family transcriptional regulator [Konateibacter massiliensis]
MKAQVVDLYDCAKEKYNLALQCGEQGLTNSVSWVYLAEDIQNVSFLKGGELVITTGLFIQSNIKLSEFICSLVTCNCSGILINIGKYLEDDDITEEIKAFCEINHFPLFTMPWEVHLIDIMQDYCSILLHNTQSTEHLNAAFQGAIYQNVVHENILLSLNQYGFPTDAQYRMIAIQNLQNMTRITFVLNHHRLKYHLFEHENRKILIYMTSTSDLSLNELIEVLLFCDSIIIGISNTIDSLVEISQCYKRAMFSLAAAIFWNIQSVNFDDLGIFQILFSSSNPEVLQAISKKYLGKLEQFDMEHDTEYLDTLKIYLLSDCNLLKSASAMHTHRNTIIYRMKKIKVLLDSELDDSKIKFDLLMAFYIREYFSIF